MAARGGHRGMAEVMTPRTTRIPRATTIFYSFEKKWNDLQIGRQGWYSIERLESLDHYCKTTSRTRAIMVCLLIPLPSLFIVIFLECLPLRPPSDGWSANWMFWIRLGLAAWIMNVAGMNQIVLYVPNLKFSVPKRILAASVASAAFIGTTIAITCSIGFPVPFVSMLIPAIFGVYVPLTLLLIIGREQLTSNSNRVHLERYSRIFSAYIIVAGGYPFFNVLYALLPVGYRVNAVVGLPIWRFAAKHAIVNASRELEDFMPELVAFTVGFYSSLFVSTCMSTSGSIFISLVFIAADVGQMLLEFREVRTNANQLLRLIRTTCRQISPQITLLRQNATAKTADLLAIILSLARNPENNDAELLQNIRLRACLSHPLTAAQTKRLQILEASGRYSSIESQRRESRRTNKWLKSLQKQRASIVPLTRINVGGSSREISNVHIQKGLISQGLQLLFHCEYLTMVEYVECVIPIALVTYKVVLEQLPNAIYYPGGNGVWGVRAAVNIAVLAVLEFITFVFHTMFFGRNFAFSPLHQLAFVLETQVYTVQAKLLVAIVVVLTYELQHLGDDFTFRFKWLRGQTH